MFRLNRLAYSAMTSLSLLCFAAPPASSQSMTPAQWTRPQASQIQVKPDNTTLNFRPPEGKIFPGFHIWDSWPVRNRNGSVANINGWVVFVGLSAPDDVLPGKRHDIAAYRYLYSRDGVNWIPGGLVFEGGPTPFGSRQWAGSTMYDAATQKLWVFYTATGERGESQPTSLQRMAAASAKVVADFNGVRFTGWSAHRIIFQADGAMYQTLQQSIGSGIIYAFRDPWFYTDPRDGKSYILFEGNTATPQNNGSGGVEPCPGDADSGAGCSGGGTTAEDYNGNVGLAVSPNGDLFNWRLLPPVIHANSVNQQLERPHFVFRDNRYYLFVSSHKFTFAPGLDGPDGLYGFVADSVYGQYVPLNGSGLVLTNPTEDPFLAYSWLVLPDLTVQSFINYFGLGPLDLNDVGNQPPAVQFEKFGGTWAPFQQLAMRGTNTKVVTGDVNLDGEASCADLQALRLSFGRRLGMPGYNREADVNLDNMVNVMDLQMVSRRLPAGTRCQ